jgi:hypothetical protein
LNVIGVNAMVSGTRWNVRRLPLMLGAVPHNSVFGGVFAKIS